MTPIELFDTAERIEFDTDLEQIAAKVHEFALTQQVTPQDDVERSIVAMTLWLHRYGKVFKVPKAWGCFLNDVRWIAHKLGLHDFLKPETFGELWRKLLPQSVEEVRAQNALLHFTHLFGSDMGRWLVSNAIRDSMELRLSPAMIAERLEQGYKPHD